MDKNFIRQDVAAEEETQWYDAAQLTLYGLMPDDFLSRRMSKSVAEQVNDGVENYSRYGAGGRVRFSTNSPYVALKVEYEHCSLPTVNNHCVSFGFDLYQLEEGKEVFVAAARPVAGFDRKHGEYKMETRSVEMTEYTLNFPIFCAIKSLQIGLQKGSAMGPGAEYFNDKPVVFYGSSITHGAAAGRPGNTYESFISQKYNLDYVNLGFSGSARGETVMAEYIAGLTMSLFVCDYDHNAPNAEHLEKTHYPFYELIRQKQPDVPYVMISRPTYYMRPEVNEKRRQVIIDSFERAKANGDRNVYFIDGATLFEGEAAMSCTSDGIHPNDLGFFRMAGKIGPVIAKILGIEE